MSTDPLTKESFKELFQQQYQALCNFGYSYLRNREVSEDIVQSVFIYLWENRSTLEIRTSIVSYLYQSVRNRVIDHIRKTKTESAYKAEILQQMESETQGEFDLRMQDALIREKIVEALQLLKPKTRKIFNLSKMEGMTYQEISDHLSIPKRTVENNMASAFRQLKEILEEDRELMEHIGWK